MIRDTYGFCKRSLFRDRRMPLNLKGSALKYLGMTGQLAVRK